MNAIDGPLVTVVIPTWNRFGLVAEAVASVVAQTYGNWELIVVDDGSADNTIPRLESLRIPRLKIVRSEHIGHLGRLRNLGVALAKDHSSPCWIPTISGARRSSGGKYRRPWQTPAQSGLPQASTPLPRICIGPL